MSYKTKKSKQIYSSIPPSKTGSVDRIDQRILIVDDEPALLTALVDKFTRAGFIVNIAENGKEGLESAFKYKPDLILLDIIMPVMDGMTMLYKLRQERWGNSIKVILLTNLSDPGIISQSIVQKVNGYLVKSDWKINDVVGEVKKKLAK
jgi:CheY-like chemotaxis protein